MTIKRWIQTLGLVAATSALPGSASAMGHPEGGLRSAVVRRVADLISREEVHHVLTGLNQGGQPLGAQENEYLGILALTHVAHPEFAPVAEANARHLLGPLEPSNFIGSGSRMRQLRNSAVAYVRDLNGLRARDPYPGFAEAWGRLFPEDRFSESDSRAFVDHLSENIIPGAELRALGGPGLNKLKDLLRAGKGLLATQGENAVLRRALDQMDHRERGERRQERRIEDLPKREAVLAANQATVENLLRDPALALPFGPMTHEQRAAGIERARQGLFEIRRELDESFPNGPPAPPPAVAPQPPRVMTDGEYMVRSTLNRRGLPSSYDGMRRF